MTFIALVANGNIGNYSKTAERLKLAKEIIAVDGGLAHCEQMRITPDLLIGDLDSCPGSLLEKYPKLKIKRYPVDKDETDLEIALKLANEQQLPIHLFGALDLRIDHTLYNLHLIRRYPGKAMIESDAEIVSVIVKKAIVETTPGQIISLIPIGGPASGITTQGLKWELNNAHFDADKSSISNSALGSTFNISIESGDLLCIRV